MNCSHDLHRLKSGLDVADDLYIHAPSAKTDGSEGLTTMFIATNVGRGSKEMEIFHDNFS